MLKTIKREELMAEAQAILDEVPPLQAARYLFGLAQLTVANSCRTRRDFDHAVEELRKHQILHDVLLREQLPAKA
jgi:hypothetical protein